MLAAAIDSARRHFGSRVSWVYKHPPMRARSARAPSTAALLAVIACAAACSGADVVTDSVPDVPIGSALETVDLDLTHISSVSELRSEALIVTDPIEGRVLLLAPGSVTDLGRTGSGPGEYQRPVRLLAYRHDSVLVIDTQLRRFTVLSPEAAFVRVISFPQATPGMTPRGADASGRIYFESEVPWPPPDSIPVVAWDPANDVADTVALLDAPDLVAVTRTLMNPSANTSQVSRMVLRHAWSARDEWAVVPTSDLVIIRNAPVVIERLNVRSGHRSTRTLPLSTVSATPDERAEVGRQEGTPSKRLTDKPPFVDGGMAMSPAGEVWMERHRAQADTMRAYLVLDRAGTPLCQVRVQPRYSLAGLGRRRAFFVHQLDDGRQRLSVFRSPCDSRD